jgi:coproporphyrinogen III oxidase
MAQDTSATTRITTLPPHIKPQNTRRPKQKLMETRLLGQGIKHISHNKNNNSPTSHQTSKHQKTKTEADGN